MDLAALRRKAVKAGIPAGIVEKDYVLSVALWKLAQTPLAGKLVFKGGTALKKIYFEDARYSEDLDFSAHGIEPQEIMRELKAAFDNSEILSVKFGEAEVVKTKEGLKVSLKYSSFLSHPQHIMFDFSFRDNEFLAPAKLGVFDEYSLGKTEIAVMPLAEVFAEKIHAVFCRHAARDLYDIWFLLKKRMELDEGLVRKKFAYYDEKYEPMKLRERASLLKAKWHQDLRQLIPEVPDFGALLEETVKMMEKKR